jgi:hypothetical protein
MFRSGSLWIEDALVGGADLSVARLEVVFLSQSRVELI